MMMLGLKGLIVYTLASGPLVRLRMPVKRNGGEL